MCGKFPRRRVSGGWIYAPPGTAGEGFRGSSPSETPRPGTHRIPKRCVYFCLHSPQHAEKHGLSRGNGVPAPRDVDRTAGKHPAGNKEIKKKLSGVPARRAGTTGRRTDTTGRRTDTTERRTDTTERRTDTTERRAGTTERRAGTTERRAGARAGKGKQVMTNASHWAYAGGVVPLRHRETGCVRPLRTAGREPLALSERIYNLVTIFVPAALDKPPPPRYIKGKD